MEIPPQPDPSQAQPPQGQAHRPDASVPRDAAGRPAATTPKKATPTQFFLKGLALVLPPILTLVILVWIGQMIYGYVVNPITTGVRFVIAEMIDKSQPTIDLVQPAGLPPLEYCGTNYRIPPAVAPELLAPAAAEKNKTAPGDTKKGDRAPNSELAAAVAYVPIGDRSIPYRDFAEVAARMRRPTGRPPRPACTWSWSPSAISRVWAL